MTNTPLVSIVIPVYNREKYVGITLDSVIKQSYTNLEIIVVNDGSTDKSLEILKSYELVDKRIRVIDKVNAGVSVARETGMMVSTGDYIFYLDADDILDKSAIEKTSNSEYFYQKLGNLALKNKDIDTTLNCYRKVLEANPRNREILVKIATILQTYFPENTEETIDCYERLLEFDIDTAQIYYELGHLYMSKEDKLNS